MNNIAKYTIICILILSTILLSSQTVRSEDNKITIEYFYDESDRCDSCNYTKPLINSLELYYGDKINLQRSPVEDDPETENYSKMVDYYEFRHYPALVVLNESSGSYTKFTYNDLYDEDNDLDPLEQPFETLKSTIDLYLAGSNEETQTDQGIDFNVFLIIAPIVIALIIVVFITNKHR